MPLLCTVEGGLGDREPPDGSKQPDSIQGGEGRSDLGEKTAGGDNVIACGGVDSCVDEQGDGPHFPHHYPVTIATYNKLTA